MLRVEGIETFYGTSQALFGVDLEVGAGDFATLMGRNGMGKTTTVHSIMGITPVRAGRITFDGEPIHGLPSHRIARAGIGLVPEGRQVFPNLSVRENLVATQSNPLGRDDPWTIDKIYAMFPELGARSTSMGPMLSGGEQQLLASGRALMTTPRFLILAEATEGLAPLVRKEIWACLERLKAESQAILVIDKNVDDLVRIADKHFIIEKGRVVWSGTSRDLLDEKQVLDRYLGV